MALAAFWLLSGLLAVVAEARPACDADAPSLRLPFSERHAVMQGNDGEFSHQGRYRYAWDFEMAEGTLVLAAAAGTVVEVIDGFDEGGPDRSLENRANLVVVDHGQGRFSVYQHLRRGGSLVSEGDEVAAGRAIARSGNTGWTTRPHLHFAVINEKNASLPVCFDDVEGGVPRDGEVYGPGPARPAQARGLSTLSRDAFSANGVLLDVDLLSRWLSRSSSAPLSGRVTRPGRRVVAFLMSRDGGRSIHQDAGRVGLNGRFSFRFDFSGLEGPWNFAMAVEEENGGFHSDFSIPVVLRASR